MRAWKAHHKRLEAVAFSPDGRLLASAGWEPAVKVWEAASGRLLWDTGPPARGPTVIPAMAFSPCGQWLAAAAEGGVRVHEPGTGHPVAFLPRPGPSPYGTCSALAFTPDDERLVMDASSGVEGECRLQWWQTGQWTMSVDWEGGRGGRYLRAAVTPDGRTLAAISYGSLQLWDIAEERIRWSARVIVSHGVSVLAPLPDGSRLAYAAGPELHIVDVSSGSRVASVRPSAKHVQGAAFSPDGRSLVTVSNDRAAVVWDTDTWGQKQAYAWRVGQLKCVAFSPDGSLIAAGGDTGKVVVWDAS